ncbi:MAG: 50S ribosomal protein L1 [Planctomycetota bacterium]|nr:MAG: 50S ribosomal protein L1 [Planctomycetota bacterium]
MGKQSKRYLENVKKVDCDKLYSVTEAVKILKSFENAKFDETVEMVFNLEINPKKADQLVRGAFSLPHGIGKKVKVIAFCDDETAKQALEAGAIEAGSEDLVAKVSGGWLDFDVAIAAPNMMAKVGKLGRVLGPTGKMPSPKSGTVSVDVVKAVTEFVAGKIDFRNDDTSNVHTVVGKASFDEQKIAENVDALIKHIKEIKPQSAKEGYIMSMSIATTMGPGIKIAV